MRTVAAILLVVCILSSLVLLVPAAPTARAGQPSTQTWDTTADFDGGVKGDPGNNFFANFALDQPSNFINWPSAVYYQGRTYVAWQGDGGWRPYLSVYDHAGAKWLGPYLIASSNPLAGTQDGHGSPSILIDAAGNIHAFFGSHSSPQKYSRSSVADPSTWTVMGDPDASATYPHPVQYGSSIYMFFRQGSLPNAPESYRVSADSGSTWGARQAFLNFANGAVYMWGTEQSGSKWYFTFNYYSPGDGLRHSLYAGYFDFATNHVFSIAGADLGSNVDLGAANTSLRLENTIGSAWQILSLGIHLDISGKPYLIYRSGVDPSNWRFNFTRWNGAAWTAPVTIRTTDSGVFNEGDFIIRSATNIEAFLIGPGIHGTGGDVERWTWNGASWTQGATILSQRASGKSLSGPIVPLGWQEGFRVWFAQTDQQNYTRPSQKLYAWGSGGFLNDTLTSSGTWSAETVTDDAQIPTGRMELSSGKGDTFSKADSDGNTSRWNFGVRIGLGGSLAGACPGFVIAGGVATASVTKDQSTECDLSSTFTVSGNFDVRVKTSTPIDGSGRREQLCLVDEPLACDYGLAYSTTMKGFLYGHDVDASAYALNISGGTFTQIGSTSTVSADPFWERIDRIGNTFNFRYSTDGSAWTLDETFVRGDAPSSFIVTLSYVNNGATDGTGTFDDFNVIAGTVDPGGYRTSGSWKPPAADYAGLFPSSVAVTYSGVSSTYTLNLQIVSATGFVLFQLPAPLTSGTTYTWTINKGDAEFAVPWALRVVLAGDGAGTASVDVVTLSTDFLSSYGGGSGTVIPQFTYGPHVTLLDAFSDNLLYFQDGSVIPDSFSNPTVVWNFGDGSRLTTGRSVAHNYNYTIVATFTVTMTICGGPPGGTQCLATNRSVTLFQWHVLAVALFLVGTFSGSMYAILYYAHHQTLPPRGLVARRAVRWLRR